MKKAFIILSILLYTFFLGAQVTLSTDFTDEGNKKDPLHNIWTVANRISPTKGGIVRPGLNVNTVRMLGGIVKTVDGKKVPDYNYDPCHYDSLTNTYVYNWAPLKSRINAQLNSNYNLFQIVIDQPPWAFQHGYTFIPEGTLDSIHFRENERQSSYGNSLPPADPQAYHTFIKAMMEELISSYGKSVVEKWRFRVGSEIETPEHWYGSKQDFIEHYANTANAVRSVLPGAKVGLHTREPNFIYKQGTVLNYRGEVISSFAKDLIEYCFDNNVTYDFWGVSDYVLINSMEDRDISQRYETLVAPLVNHPKWNPDASIDIMEYKVVTSMNPPDGGSTLPCVTSHTEVYHIALANLFYKNKTKGLDQVFRWGQRPNSTDPPGIEVLNSMMGKMYYHTELSGTPAVSGNLIDAIFSSDESNEEFDIMLYNYNAGSLNSKAEEDVTLTFATALPAGTTLYYRNLTYGEKQNPLQNFLENEPASGWIKEGFDRKGDPSRTLNEAGAAAWALYENPRPYKFSEWKSVTSTPRSDGGEGSVISLTTQLPSFAFKKFEFRLHTDFVEVLSIPKFQWTTDQDFTDFSEYQMTASINDNLFELSLSGNYPKIVYNESLNADFFDQFRIVLKNETLSDVFWLAWYKNGIKSQIRFSPTPSLSDTSFHVYSVDLSTITNWNGAIDYFHIETANKVGAGLVTIDTIEFLTRAGVVEQFVTVSIDGEGWVNPASGTCFTGQDVDFTAIPFPGYLFDGWTGDIISPDNPLSVVVDSDLSLTAHFLLMPKNYTLKTSANNGIVERSPSKSLYEEGSTVLLTAVPNSGFKFDSWSGDLIGTENPFLLTMDTSKNITANFSRIRYTLNVSAENGTVERYPDQADYDEGETVLVKAFPDKGFVFESWSGDMSDTIDRISIVMDADKHITANFSIIQGLSRGKNLEALTIYPNPSSGQFNVSVNNEKVSFYHIFNSQGVEIQLGSFNPATRIKIKDRGIYFILFETEDEVFSQKLIVQ